MEKRSASTSRPDRIAFSGVPPVLSKNAADTLQRVLSTLSLFIVAFGFYGSITGVRQAWTPALLALPVVLVCIWRMRRGHINQAIVIFCWGFWLIAGLNSFLVAGIYTPTLFVFPALVVIIAYVQNSRASLLMATASIGVLWASMNAQTSGWFPGFEMRSPTQTLWVYSGILIASAFIARLISDHLRLLADRERQNSLELTRLNEDLEQRVAIRTEELQLANTALTETLKFNETILLNSPFPMAVYGAEGNCVEANETFCQIQATTREGLLQYHNMSDYKDFGLFDDFQNAVNTQQPQQREVSDPALFGRNLFLEYRFISVIASNSQHVLVQIVDLTDRRLREQELHQMAFDDALTKLPNRRLLMDRMKHAIASSKRHNSHGAVLFLDLNKFKHLNDTHGHEAGDQLLIVVADRLRAAVRQTDTVARLGGDEFVVLLEELGPDSTVATEIAGKMVEKIRTSLIEEYVLGEIRHHSSASIGIALFLADLIDPEQVLKNADAAMYEAKRARGKTEER